MQKSATFSLALHILLDWFIHQFYPQNGICIMISKSFWNLSMRKDSYFNYSICYFGHFYEVRKSSLPHWGNVFFSRPLFTIIFRPKIVFLDTNSILRVKKMNQSSKMSCKLSAFDHLFKILDKNENNFKALATFNHLFWN